MHSGFHGLTDKPICKHPTLDWKTSINECRKKYSKISLIRPICNAPSEPNPIGPAYQLPLTFHHLLPDNGISKFPRTSGRKPRVLPPSLFPPSTLACTEARKTIATHHLPPYYPLVMPLSYFHPS